MSRKYIKKTPCDFQIILSKVITTFSGIQDFGNQMEIANKIFLTSSEDAKKFDKSYTSNLVNGNRNIPKFFYKNMADVEMKNQFIKNLNHMFTEIGDGETLSEIVRFIQDEFQTNQKNDGDNIKYIIEVIKEKLESELEYYTQPVKFYKFVPPHGDFFLGRKDELYELSCDLDSKGYAVLSGEPGIGKSEIALKFASDSLKTDTYTNILKVEYHDSLADTFKDILKKHSYNRELADDPNAYNIVVSNLNHLGKKVLVIIERMNVDFKNDLKFDEEMQKYQFHLIITTRSRYDGAIVVTGLPYRYAKKMMSELGYQMKIDIDSENYNWTYNPFIYYISSKSDNNYYDNEFQCLNTAKYGKQCLSFVAWLNRLYDFKSLSADERHVLKFLSIFENNTYDFTYINYFCPLCSQEMVNRLVNLGWLSYCSPNYYLNAFEWWNYYSFFGNRIDIIEFSEETKKIIQKYNQDLYGEILGLNIMHYVAAANKINGRSAEWTDFATDVAKRYMHINPLVSISILTNSRSGSDIINHFATKCVMSYKRREIVSLTNNYESSRNIAADNSNSKPKLYTADSICEKFSHDIYLIDNWCDLYICNFLLSLPDNCYACEKNIRTVVEQYASSRNFDRTFDCNKQIFEKIIQDTTDSRDSSQSIIYHTLKDLVNSAETVFPEERISQLFLMLKELMPMVKLINKFSQLIHSNKSTNYANELLPILTKEVERYGKLKNHDHLLLFYDMISKEYVDLGIYDSAEKIMKESESFVTQGDPDTHFHINFTALMKTVISLCRYINQTCDKDLDEKLILKITEALKGFSEYDPFTQTLFESIVYRYCIFEIDKRSCINAFNWLIENIHRVAKEIDKIYANRDELNLAPIIP